jgi:2-oxoglutarate ferredoxin oxidoreductase subunit delta
MRIGHVLPKRNSHVNLCHSEEVSKMAKKVKEIIVNTEWCKGCGICVHFCPKKVLKLDKGNKAVVADLDSCIGCKLCELRCPDFAIEVKFLDNEQG